MRNNLELGRKEWDSNADPCCKQSNYFQNQSQSPHKSAASAGG
jgi:hypothetical protein